MIRNTFTLRSRTSRQITADVVFAFALGAVSAIALIEWLAV